MTPKYKVTDRSEIDANRGRKPYLPECVENKIAKMSLKPQKGEWVFQVRCVFSVHLFYANAFGSRPSKMALPGEDGGIALKNKRHPQLAIRKPGNFASQDV